MPSGAFFIKGTLDTKKRNDLKTQLKAQFQGSRNRGKVLLLDKDHTFQPLSMTPESAEMVANREFMVAEIARVFNLSPILLGQLQNASYSNASQASQFLSRFTLQYWTTLFEASFSDFLLPEDERLELDISVMAKGDTKERWDAYKIALETKVLTPADVRRLEGFEEPNEPEQQQTEVEDNG